MSGRPDPSRALLRALTTRIGANIGTIRLVGSRPWASITFTGARHELTADFSGTDADCAADRFLAGLDVAEFDLRGHILADIALVSRTGSPAGVALRLEALTVEDG